MSWLAARDDRARLLALAALAVGITAVQQPSWAALGLGLSLLTCLLARVPRGVLARRLAPLLALLVPVALLTPFWGPPQAHLLHPGWVYGPTVEGLEVAGTVTARVLAVAALAVALLGVAPPERTVLALQSLGLPAPLGHTALLTARYLGEVEQDLARTRLALAARGFSARPGPSSWRTYAWLSAGLLLRSLARTERLEQAMRCRGYTGRLVAPERARWGAADALLVLGAVALAGALWAGDRGLLPGSAA